MAQIIEVDDNVLKGLDQLGVSYNLKNEDKFKQISDLDRSKWIAMPYEFTNGEYSLIFDPARLYNNSAVEKAGKELEIKYKNSAEDSLGREFIGNNNWYDSLRLNLALGNGTMSPKEFKDSLKLLYQGMQGKIKVYNNSGKQIDSKFLKNVFEDIVKIKNPWRAEFLDADFKVKEGKLHINYNHVLDSTGNLIPKNSEVLDKETLMQDKLPGINLEDYLTRKHTIQGLPNKNISSGDLYYWYPRSDNSSVARFDAYGNGADLNCYRNPSDAGSDFGVRAVRRE